MGTRSRPKPKHLAKKLRQIRLSLGLSQDGLIERLGVEEEVVRSTISAFERGVREPSYPLLLKYARLAGVSTDLLIDDDVELDLS
ncbi:MAG: helix-turn-helix transcriptional regulator [Chloracidobacterium sp.]|nr:helix-turn-helix transcriptional regulator [Chloracidobacterium sp.]